MQLGKDTASIVNWIQGNSISIKPQVGMGATLLMWSDRHPYTIHKISEDNKKLWASLDNYKRIDNNGFSEIQDYEYWNENEKNPDRWQLFTFRKDNRWHQGTKLSGTVLSIGHREEYYDFTR